MKRSGLFVSALCSVIFLSVCSAVSAADGVWTNTASGGWSDTNNWAGGVVAGDEGSATFTATSGVYTVSNDLGLVSLSGITVNPDVGQGASWIIRGGTNELVAPAIINVVSGSLALVKAFLISEENVSLTGAGLLSLTADAMAYTGSTSIAAGTLRVTPLGPPVTDGLSYRLDATARGSLTLDGANVTDWADITAAEIMFSQGDTNSQPTYIDNAINGLPAVRFSDSSRNRMYADKSAVAQTVFIVNKNTSFGSLDGIWGNNLVDAGIRGASSTSWQHPGNDDTFNETGEIRIDGIVKNSFTFGAPHILMADRSNSVSWVTAIGDYWKSNDYTRSYRGYIGEVLVYGRKLTDPEKDAVTAYLKEKWIDGDGTALGITSVDVAQGAQFSVQNMELTVDSLSGPGDLDASGSQVNLLEYSSFTGTVSGAGTVALAADGADALFTLLDWSVTVRNDGASDATIVVDSAATNVFIGSVQDGSSAMGLTKTGAGVTLFSGAGSTYSGSTLIEAGVVSIGGTVFTKFIRFYPQMTRATGDNTGTGYQLSEFHIMLNGDQVAYPIGTLASSPGLVPDGNEDPEHAIDGKITTKFYVNSIPLKPLVIELPEPILFDGYRWYTANDATGRDPVIWSVDVSEDGLDWYSVDLQDYSTNQDAVTELRRTLVGAWVMNAAGGANSLSDLAATTVASSAELRIEATSETVGSLSGNGDITLADGTLGINAFTNATFSGAISGSGSIVKKGSEKQSLSGALSVTGEIVVEEGVLDLEGAVLTGITNIIIKTGGTLTGSASVANDLTVTFEGGAYSATLAVSGSLATSGIVNLTIPEGETYPLRYLLFSYTSVDQVTKDALDGAVFVLSMPPGYEANVFVTDTYARLAVAASGTLVIIQ